MHDLEGLFYKTAKHWINRKFDPRKKTLHGPNPVGPTGRGDLERLLTSGLGPAGGEGRPAGRWQAGPLGYWIDRAPADPTGSRQGRVRSTEAAGCVIYLLRKK